MLRVLWLSIAAGMAVACSSAGEGPDAGQALEPGFNVSYTAGGRDSSGALMGGTEMRNLAAHGGKLYAGNGYWEDQPGFEGPHGAQVLVLDRPDGQWRVDGEFSQRLANGRPRHLAVASLLSVTFRYSGEGRPLPSPVSMLLAGTWDLSGSSQIFSRDGTTGTWTPMNLAAPRVAPPEIQQVRSLGFHRDRVTGIETVFAGNDPYGVYTGTYDPAASGQIRWSASPELDLARIAGGPFPGLSLVRVSSLAECDGVLYAAVGQQLYGRVDGAAPHWERVFTNSQPGYSETGLRGLTCIHNPEGSGDTLLAAIEGTIGRIVRIDPKTGAERTEVNVNTLLGQAWGTRVVYVISAYNLMAPLPEASGGDSGGLLIGIEAKFAKDAPIPRGRATVAGFNGGGWYLLRDREARYSLHKLGDRHPGTGHPLVSTREILASPFHDGRIYFAGYDANKVAAHNTAWVISAPETTVTGP